MASITLCKTMRFLVLQNIRSVNGLTTTHKSSPTTTLLFFNYFFFSLLCHNFLWVIMRALHRHGFTIFFSRKYCCPYFTEVCLSKLWHEMVISEMQPDGMHHGLCLFQGFVIREVIFWLIIVLWWQHLFSNFDRLC